MYEQLAKDTLNLVNFLNDSNYKKIIIIGATPLCEDSRKTHLEYFGGDGVKVITYFRGKHGENHVRFSNPPENFSGSVAVYVDFFGDTGGENKPVDADLVDADLSDLVGEIADRLREKYPEKDIKEFVLSHKA